MFIYKNVLLSYFKCICKLCVQQDFFFKSFSSTSSSNFFDPGHFSSSKSKFPLLNLWNHFLHVLQEITSLSKAEQIISLTSAVNFFSIEMRKVDCLKCCFSNDIAFITVFFEVMLAELPTIIIRFKA